MRGQTPTRPRDAIEPPDEPCGVGPFSLLVSSAQGVFSQALPDVEPLVLGRAAGSHVVIDDPSVSRRHATLWLRGEIAVEDGGATNGTRLNGVKLRPRERTTFDLGAILELGSAIVLLQRGAPLLEQTLTVKSSRGGHARPSTFAPAIDPPVAEDPAMKALYALLALVSRSTLSVLLRGETGVGKEVFAEAIHRSSPRQGMPFLSINCAALPDGVLDAELFGYEKGAFTGAVHARPGLFEAASGGTLFLDEVGDLPAHTQAKLLRVLASGELLRIGSRTAMRTDVRIVAATNRDLNAMVARGEFRADLFFRLNGMTLTIPPLRQRKGDLVPLARLFLARAYARLGQPMPALSARCQELLGGYDWPGNVRELQNVMERTVALCQGSLLGEAELRFAAPELCVECETPPASEPPQPPRAAGALRREVESVEKTQILTALAQANGNQKRAAALLGISRRTLLHKLDLHAIGRPRK